MYGEVIICTLLKLDLSILKYKHYVTKLNKFQSVIIRNQIIWDKTLQISVYHTYFYYVLKCANFLTLYTIFFLVYNSLRKGCLKCYFTTVLLGARYRGYLWLLAILNVYRGTHIKYYYSSLFKNTLILFYFFINLKWYPQPLKYYLKFQLS